MRHEGVGVGAKLGHNDRHPLGHQAGDEGDLARGGRAWRPLRGIWRFAPCRWCLAPVTGNIFLKSRTACQRRRRKSPLDKRLCNGRGVDRIRGRKRPQHAPACRPVVLRSGRLPGRRWPHVDRRARPRRVLKQDQHGDPLALGDRIAEPLTQFGDRSHHLRGDPANPVGVRGHDTGHGQRASDHAIGDGGELNLRPGDLVSGKLDDAFGPMCMAVLRRLLRRNALCEEGTGRRRSSPSRTTCWGADPRSHRAHHRSRKPQGRDQR